MALRKKKNLHLRFILTFIAFIIEVTLFIVFLFLILNFESYRFYFLIPLIVCFLLNIILAIFIPNTKVGVDFKVSWLAVVLLLPFAGAILYLMFAHKITTKRRKEIINNRIHHYLEEYIYLDDKELKEEYALDKDAYSISKYISKCGYPLHKNSKFNYFESGEEGFPYIVKELKKAKKFIFFEYFIIENGEMFDTLYNIFKEKVKEGVEVYFLYDDVGTATKMPSSFYKKVRKDGINCYPFNRISPTINIRQNSRDHRKIIVIDGVIGFTGGANIADEYINKRVRFGYWKDNFLMIKGEAVNSLALSFLVSYYIASRKELDFNKYSYFNNKEYLENSYSHEKEFVQPYSDYPFDDDDISRDIYLKMIRLAKDYIYLSTPYLIPDSELENALITASKSGVKVKIITPGIPDKKIVYQVTKSFYANLMLSGIEIIEFTPGFNHEKTIIVDDKMALSGTANFEFRSLYLHLENGVFIFNNQEELRKIKNSLEWMINQGTLQKLDNYLNVSLFRRWMWSLLRIIAPLL